MKIRCGSHQQNRSIVRPGLSLMAAKVALTAEEFRENSQRSIALFNTEKLSTNSTHVLKSAYCNSVHFCRCNLHGACGGKEVRVWPERNDSRVAICTERVEAKEQNRRESRRRSCCNLHGACGGKAGFKALNISKFMLQSARSVWRQRIVSRKFVLKIKLQSARSVWRQRLCEAGFRYSLPLQSARSVWRQRCTSISSVLLINRCNLHGACGGKDADISLHFSFPRCNLHGACGGKVVLLGAYNTFYTLQSARGVWKTLHHPPEKNPRKFMQTYCIFIHLGV